MKRLSAIVAAVLIGTAGASAFSPLRAQENVSKDAVQRLDMPVSLLEAGAAAAEAERVLGRPTATALFDGAVGADRALIYGDGPARTRVTITSGRVSAIALDLLAIDAATVPARARMVKPMMRRGGVLALLGRPAENETRIGSGVALEEMRFATAGEPDFSLLLADGVVVEVKPGGGERPALPRLTLPAAISDAAVGQDLRIGLSPSQARSLLGPPVWPATIATLAGQPVLHATHHERGGSRFVSLTYVGGALTAFALWSPDTALGSGDTASVAAAPHESVRVR